MPPPPTPFSMFMRISVSSAALCEYTIIHSNLLSNENLRNLIMHSIQKDPADRPIISIDFIINKKGLLSFYQYQTRGFCKWFRVQNAASYTSKEFEQFMCQRLCWLASGEMWTSDNLSNARHLPLGIVDSKTTSSSKGQAKASCSFETTSISSHHCGIFADVII